MNFVNIGADATNNEVRHYDIEFSRAPGGGCSDVLSDGRTEISGGAQLLQVGQQRFLDVWDDGCGLHNILKINADSQTLSLMPVDPELLEDLIDNKTVNLQGRTEGGGRWFLTEILLAGEG